MKNKCKRYAQAITDYVLGEEIDVPKEELTAHLNECTQCRKELTNWQDFQDMLRVKEYHSRPEVKEKWDSFIKELVASGAERSPDERRGQPIPAEVKPIRGAMLDHEAETGTLAGTVWRCLAKYGEVSEADLPQKAKLHPLKAHEGLGWLMHQKKVYKTKDKQTIYLYLNETEREIYQQQEARV